MFFKKTSYKVFPLKSPLVINEDLLGYALIIHASPTFLDGKLKPYFFNFCPHVECKTQLDAFKIIAKKAKELGVVDNEKKLIDGLVRREKVSTTGMKDSFAIPHAMQGNVKEPTIIAVRFKNGVD